MPWTLRERIRRECDRSIRRDRFDHTVILGAAHLRRVLKAYTDYYNNDRTHLGLNKDAPDSRPVKAGEAIVSRPVLGGLHRRYGEFPRNDVSEGTGRWRTRRWGGRGA